MLHRNIRHGGVGEQGMVGGEEGGIGQPVIKPEGGGCTIVNSDQSNRAVGVEFVVDNCPKKAGGAIDRGMEGGSVVKNPLSPANWFPREKFGKDMYNCVYSCVFEKGKKVDSSIWSSP